MGATVTTNKLAAAFDSGRGVIYALFEQVYEKNCYPHTPEWCGVEIGSIEAVLRRVFALAAGCEGGMLQTRRGWTKPENYIGGWLKALASPAELADQSVSLRCSSEYSATIPPAAREQACARLTAIGHGATAARLMEGEEIELRLHRDIEAICAVFDGTHLMSWRIFGRCWAPFGAKPLPQLGYRPQVASSYSLPDRAFLRVAENDDNRLAQDENGVWRCAGSPYSIVGSYVSKLWRDELSEPGSYVARIEALRKAVESAPLVPDDAKVVVDLNAKLESKYHIDQVARLPNAIEGIREGSQFVFPVPKERDGLYLATSLPRSCTHWVVGAPAGTC